MKLKRLLFEPCPIDKILRFGRLSHGIQGCPREGIESTYHPQDMGYGRGREVIPPLGSIQRHLAEDNRREG